VAQEAEVLKMSLELHWAAVELVKASTRYLPARFSEMESKAMNDSQPRTLSEECLPWNVSFQFVERSGALQ
jgi:hypothetical protein